VKPTFFEMSKFLSVGKVSKEEARRVTRKAEKYNECASVFLENGVVQIEGLYESEKAREAYRDALRNFVEVLRVLRRRGKRLGRGTKHGFAEIVKRTKGRFEMLHGMRDVYEKYLSKNKRLEEFLSRVLGQDFHLVYADMLISFPGATDQQWHVDGPHRAGAQEHYPPDILNCFIALDDIDVAMGPTEIRPETHKLTRNMKKQVLGAILTKKLRPKVRSACKCGDALVFDYRTLHRGVANLSSRSRPVLGLVFGRKEYKADKLNFPVRSVFDLMSDDDDDGGNDVVTKSNVLCAASSKELHISLDTETIGYVLQPSLFQDLLKTATELAKWHDS